MKERNTPSRLPNVQSARLPVASSGMMQHTDPFESDDFKLKEYFKITLKYRTLIIGIAGLSIVFSLLYAFLATPLYTTSSKIRIGTYEPVLASTGIEGVMQEKSKEANYLETQIQEISSYSLVDDVLDDEIIYGIVHESSSAKTNSHQKSVAAGGYKHSVKDIQKYLNLIKVSPVRRTSLVSILATSEDPHHSARIANMHAEAYIEWVRTNRVNQQSRAIVFLESQAADLREKVADLERDLADYAEENSIVAVNSDENITAQRMAQLSTLLTETTAKRIEAENKYKAANESLSGESSADFDDPSTQSLRTQLATLEAEYQQLSQKFTDAYPKMKELKSQISGLRSSIQGGRKSLVQGIKSRAEALKQEELRLQEELDRQKSLTFELAKRKVHYNVLHRELESSRELLQNVLRQLKESSLAVEGNSSNVSIVDYAVVPEHASHPRKFLILLFGGLLGVGAGVALALVLHYLDNTIRTAEELSTVLRVPNLGVVPSFESEPGLLEASRGNGEHAADSPQSEGNLPARSSYPIAFLEDSRSLCAEAYRTIRTAILLSQAGEPPRTLLVTSAQSSEGKTTSVMNLAVSLAGSGGKVAVIDADLRRPSLNRYFPVQPGTPGLVEVITGSVPLQHIGLSNGPRRITYYPSGNIPPNPAELLGSVEMAELIDEVASTHDYVIIDSPPVLPVTDAVLLSRLVDGVVFVVKGAHTPGPVILEAKTRLENVGARVLGTVLNDIDLKSGDYSYYNKYYSSYYRREDDADGFDQRESA